MIGTAHNCWWTRRHQTDLTRTKDGFRGAGIPIEIFRDLSSRLRVALEVRQVAEDTSSIALGQWAEGEIHDECFVTVRSNSPECGSVFLRSILGLHSHYLGAEITWDSVASELDAPLARGFTVRLKSRPASKEVVVLQYPPGASVITRFFTRRKTIRYGTTNVAGFAA